MDQQKATPQDGARNNNKPVILVTGSSGLIGTALIRSLAPGYRIIGLDREGNTYPPIEAECVTFDITDTESICLALERVRYGYGDRIAAVVHLAAYYDFSGAPSPLYDAVTVKGTQKFIDALQKFRVEQFIFSSTNLIYKPTEPGMKINEEAPLAPNWDYPESKVDTEALIREKRGAMHAVLLRLAGVYDEWGHSIPIAHQIQRIYERQLTSHFYSGDIKHGNVFVHLEDLIDAIKKTIENRETLPEILAINIGEPVTPSYEELQHQIGLLVHGEAWETYELPAPLAKMGAWTMDLFGDPFIKPWMIDRADDHYELDISRAGQLLNWAPAHRLTDTLPAIIHNLKTNPEQWYKENKLEKNK